MAETSTTTIQVPGAIADCVESDAPVEPAMWSPLGERVCVLIPVRDRAA